MEPRDIASEIVDEFSFFDDWADRYQHLIDQGRHLAALPPHYLADDYILKGCQSVVHFVSETNDEGRLIFHAASDAAIVQGLIALLWRLFRSKACIHPCAGSAFSLRLVLINIYQQPAKQVLQRWSARYMRLLKTRFNRPVLIHSPFCTRCASIGFAVHFENERLKQSRRPKQQTKSIMMSGAINDALLQGVNSDNSG